MVSHLLNLVDLLRTPGAGLNLIVIMRGEISKRKVKILIQKKIFNSFELSYILDSDLFLCNQFITYLFKARNSCDANYLNTQHKI